MTNSILTDNGLESTDVRKVFQADTTLEDILGKKIPGNTGTVDLSVFESHQELFYRVSFPEFYLSNRRLMRLLTRVRHQPIDFTQGKIGTLDDLALPDLEDPESLKRVERHKASLDPYWSIFERYHRKLFVAAIRSLSPDQLGKFFDSQAVRVISRNQAISDMPKLIDNFRAPEILLHNYELLKNYPQALLEVSKERLYNLAAFRNARSIITRAPEELRRILVDKDILKYDRIVVDIDGPPGHVGTYFNRLDYNVVSDSFNVEYLGDGVVEFNLFSSWMRLAYNGTDFDEVDRHIKGINEVDLSPMMLWSKDKNTGERAYMYSERPYELYHDLDSRANSLAGLLLAVSVSPEQRDRLPTRLNHEEAEYIAKNIHTVKSIKDMRDKLHDNFRMSGIISRQGMTEGQIALLILMYGNVLLNELPLVPRAEALYAHA